MRSFLVPFLLFSGAILMSCSEETDTSQQEFQEVDLQDQERESEQSATEEDDLLDENAVMVWKSYHNQRFDFCVGYPTNFLKEMGESENQDGNTFSTANESSEMRASGMYNALEQSISEAFDSATENGVYYDDERIVTYKQQKGNWFVVSGRYYESIFYVRTVLEGDNFYTLYFEYHSSEEEKFKEIIKHTTRDFPGC